jgi:hypothetical protein
MLPSTTLNWSVMDPDVLCGNSIWSKHPRLIGITVGATVQAAPTKTNDVESTPPVFPAALLPAMIYKPG